MKFREFNCENLFSKTVENGFLIEEDGYRRGIQNFILRFLLQNLFSSLVMNH